MRKQEEKELYHLQKANETTLGNCAPDEFFSTYLCQPCLEYKERSLHAQWEHIGGYKISLPKSSWQRKLGRRIPFKVMLSLEFLTHHIINLTIRIENPNCSSVRKIKSQLILSYVFSRSIFIGNIPFFQLGSLPKMHRFLNNQDVVS